MTLFGINSLNLDKSQPSLGFNAQFVGFIGSPRLTLAAQGFAISDELAQSKLIVDFRR
jgi:hypothetical protein